MSFEYNEIFTREKLDLYLKELAKAYRKLGGKDMPAEIILIGGAAIVAHYNFREMTTDIDAVIQAMSSMKEAANHVSDRYHLPNNWINDDFKKTTSYSPKLSQYSVYYKSFYGVLSVRVISAEYLIAMKLKAGRQYKKDLSDIAGILAEHASRGNPIEQEQIITAIINLYGTTKAISNDAMQFLVHILQEGNYKDVYETVLKEEAANRELLLDFQEVYPNTVREENADNIIALLREKKQQGLE